MFHVGYVIKINRYPLDAMLKKQSKEVKNLEKLYEGNLHKSEIQTQLCKYLHYSSLQYKSV